MRCVSSALAVQHTEEATTTATTVRDSRQEVLFGNVYSVHCIWIESVEAGSDQVRSGQSGRQPTRLVAGVVVYSVYREGERMEVEVCRSRYQKRESG